MSNPMFDVVRADLEALEEGLLDAVGSPYGLVTEIGTHLVHAGGKRIRPGLCILAARSGKNFSLERILPLAETLELIHTASLVHDDVIDGAGTRRGAETANARWGSQIAILSGDYIFARAFALIATEGYGGYILKRLSELVCNLSIGEIIQNEMIYKASRDLDAYYERIQKKTADFLEICCELGAVVGGLDPADAKALARYGHAIGMAFQITDDILDILQTEEQIGKPAGNDIRQGIVTLPVIRALSVSSDAKELETIVTNRKMTDEDVRRALAIVRETDGVDFAMKRADDYLAHAKEILPASLPKEVREAYEMVADFIGDRDF
ncbi:polyprenyl synthetase family protein [Mitsuokella sp. oral taxon 131]|uniref:polyprenyl synthetase family protein n=1 Tax=Mitsuokella sp. oral taxon 131 TaxID=1321780 RepID=UPI001E628AC7|nr:polyprenyl synthetase family protein [Mitsuokella sp. oral taxon 131]